MRSMKTKMNSAVFLLEIVMLFSVLHGSKARWFKAGCSISVNEDLPEPQPLLLIPGGSKDGQGFYLPKDSEGIIEIDAGEDILLACPGYSNYLTIGSSSMKTALATCKSGSEFTIDSDSYDFSEFSCKTYPFHVARESGEKCYDGTKTHIEIGFEVESDFYRLIDICFDEILLSSLYSNYTIVSGIGGYQSGFPRPNFIQGDFYPGLNVNTLYKKNSQREAFSTLLGSTKLGDEYIAEKGDYYLARGHLAPKAAFVYGSQHRATFHYVNVAPQWQTFNGKNWMALEMSVRTYADKNEVTLDVYTGTYGIATLPDIDNVETELYLYVDENNNKALPVPKLFWKVVYDPKTQAGIAFVGINNPYVSKPRGDYIICDDVCSDLPWLQWDPDNIARGYSYCCDVNNFRETVDTLPEFTVRSLLQ